MQQLMEWMKVKRIISISSESRLSTFSGETSGNNANNLWFPILKSCQELNPDQGFLSIIGRKLKCCQDNNGVYFFFPTSTTMEIKPIQRPSAPIKPREALTYHQVVSWMILNARWNRTTEFCNSPSFAIPDPGPTETILYIN